MVSIPDRAGRARSTPVHSHRLHRYARLPGPRPAERPAPRTHRRAPPPPRRAPSSRRPPGERCLQRTQDLAGGRGPGAGRGNGRRDGGDAVGGSGRNAAGEQGEGGRRHAGSLLGWAVPANAWATSMTPEPGENVADRAGLTRSAGGAFPDALARRPTYGRNGQNGRGRRAPPDTAIPATYSQPVQPTDEHRQLTLS